MRDQLLQILESMGANPVAESLHPTDEALLTAIQTYIAKEQSILQQVFKKAQECSKPLGIEPPATWAELPGFMNELLPKARAKCWI